MSNFLWCSNKVFSCLHCEIHWWLINVNTDVTTFLSLMTTLQHSHVICMDLHLWWHLLIVGRQVDHLLAFDSVLALFCIEFELAWTESHSLYDSWAFFDFAYFDIIRPWFLSIRANTYLFFAWYGLEDVSRMLAESLLIFPGKEILLGKESLPT